MNKNEIKVIYGDDAGAMSYKLCEAAGLKDMAGDKKRLIMLKPNLVTASGAEHGATTHPEFVHGVISYLKENGFDNLCIAEGSWVGERTKRAFSVCGYDKLSRLTGVPLIDVQEQRSVRISAGGMEFDVCAHYTPDVFLINLPVMKGHCQTVMTCALKNMKGLITDAEKRRFHTLGLHKPIAALNRAIRQDFVLVDAICGDLDFEEGGNPVPMHMAFAAADPVLCDVYACTLMGIDTKTVAYIGLAAEMGAGGTALGTAAIEALNGGVPGAFKIPRKAMKLAANIDEKDACSACYGALVRALSRLDGQIGNTKICIGQGFKGDCGEVGVGNCTAGFKHYLCGCPPTAADMLSFLTNMRS